MRSMSMLLEFGQDGRLSFMSANKFNFIIFIDLPVENNMKTKLSLETEYYFLILQIKIMNLVHMIKNKSLLQ